MGTRALGLGSRDLGFGFMGSSAFPQIVFVGPARCVDELPSLREFHF